MDFLDSLDLNKNTHDRKSDRVRSWYLLEQYKSLENHQLDAAQRLKNRSLQERLLHQELTERRGRRLLYEHSDSGHSEPRDNSLQSHRSCLSTTHDDFYESFCEIHDFECGQEFDSQSHDSDNTYTEDFKTLADFQDYTSCADSVRSVVGVSETEDTKVSKFAEKGDSSRSQSVQRTIADSIKLHLDTVKENMVSLERYTRKGDGDLSSEESVKTARRPKPDKILYKSVLLRDNQLFCLWSRLVTFAYHIVQLNHGNCCYDYGSQLLTAVLACDALRRGINRMCEFLQSYVSPIKFASESSENSSIVSLKKIKKKKPYESKKIRNNAKYKINSSFHKAYVTKGSEETCYSDLLWQHHTRYSFENKMRKHKTSTQYCNHCRECRRAESGTSDMLWPLEFDDNDERQRRHRVVTPMRELARYLADIEDFGYG